jgi:hypothetical protein
MKMRMNIKMTTQKHNYRTLIGKREQVRAMIIAPRQNFMGWVKKKERNRCEMSWEMKGDLKKKTRTLCSE